MMGIRGTGTLSVEMVGLTLSMISLILSLFIFCHFRNLWSTQTRLRKNLFIALGIQIIVRLIIAIHTLLRLSASSSNDDDIPSPTRISLSSTNHDDDSIAVLEFLRLSGAHQKSNVHDCETFFPVFILEYTRNAMFLWMFLEGLYLHSMITLFPIIQERLSLKFYYSMGWGSPILLTFIWVMMAAEKVNGRICWRSYMFTSYFWILEGPKLTIILMAIFFLLNVIRVLMTKLWRSNSPEVNQVRKAVSRSIVLVPLLGITNYLHLQMRHSPLDVEYSAWTYLTAFATSFQGVLAALIYCFLNGEVQSTLRRWYIERRNQQQQIVMVNGGPSVGFSWKKRKNTSESVVDDGNHDNDDDDHEVGDAVGLNPNDSEEEHNETCTINQSSLSQSSSLIIDAYKENWNDVDLSAHCNVDIEHIEIPIGYFTNYNNNMKQSQQKHLTPRIDNDENGDENNGKGACPRCDSRRSSAYLVELEHDENMIMINNNDEVSSIDLKSEEDDHNINDVGTKCLLRNEVK